MSYIAMDTAKLIDMLPESDQNFAYEFVKKLILAWDPDFTKVTNEEAAELDAAEKAMEDGDYYDEKEVWG